jgi:hypothetical protein
VARSTGSTAQDRKKHFFSMVDSSFLYVCYFRLHVVLSVLIARGKRFQRHTCSASRFLFMTDVVA